MSANYEVEVARICNRQYDKEITIAEAVSQFLALISNISIQSRIDELKKLPNTKPVWFDPKLHTNYVDKRVAELEAQLKTQQDTTRQESEEK